jgi:hypothetical protein
LSGILRGLAGGFARQLSGFARGFGGGFGLHSGFMQQFRLTRGFARRQGQSEFPFGDNL